MKTITEMQRQIKEMSGKLDEFARELLEYNKKDEEKKGADYAQIKAIGSRNPIEGHILKDAEEAVKKQYITLLIAAIYTSGGKTDDAWFWVQRIAAGADFNDDLADISADAANITEEQLDEFTRAVMDGGLSQALALDAMLIYISCGKKDDKMLEFMAGLFELIIFSKDIINELTAFARIIAERDSKKYEDFLHSLLLEPKKIKMEFAKLNYYIKDFYSGIQYFTEDEIYYFSKDKKVIDLESIAILKSDSFKIVTLENVTINLTEDVEITNKQNVLFRKCQFNKSSHSLQLNNCAFAEFDGCEFKDMANRVACVGSNVFSVFNCTFYNCGYSDTYFGDWGGVFKIVNPMQSLIFNNNMFHSCYIESKMEGPASGCILYSSEPIKEISIENCRFDNCRCIGAKKYASALFSANNCDKKHDENNSISGEVKTLIC